MGLFDAFMFVDWSARNGLGPVHPAPDSIWIGEKATGAMVRETYHRSRNDAMLLMVQRLSSLIGAGKRVLVGFDFPYGYPVGFAQCLTGHAGHQRWQRVWEETSCLITDDATNINNRFASASQINEKLGATGRGPFWGCPAGQATKFLHTHAPGFPFVTASGTRLHRLRISEQRLGGVQETWKLYGAGSVGSQALVGIPRVNSLRKHKDLVDCSKVWPFETGFVRSPSVQDGPLILHTEIWPGVVNEEVLAAIAADPDLIRDQAQVRCMCNWAERLDRQGNLGSLFDVPEGLNESESRICTEEEGWILGCA
jgi:hypothetical protein